METENKTRLSSVQIQMDRELREAIDAYFRDHPEWKRGWWYRQAIQEKLERERYL